MTSLGARVAVIEAAVARLASARGPRVSDLLRRARARAMAGEVPPPVLCDVAELEHQAKLPGVLGAIGKAKLRLALAPAPDALCLVARTGEARPGAR